MTNMSASRWCWLFVAGCGFEGELDTPSPPPEPPSELTQHEPDVITHTGAVGDVTPSTRTWTQSGDGQRLIAHLTDHGILTVNGQATQVADLQAGMVVTSEGKQVGDMLLVEHAEAKAAPVDADLAGSAPVPPPTPSTVTAPLTGTSPSTGTPPATVTPTPEPSAPTSPPAP